MTAKRRDEDVPRNRRPPATSPEARENQLIAKAYDLAEKQIDEGTASAQVISGFLKLGSSREKLEQHKLMLEGEFLEAKKEMLASQKRIEELYDEAIDAMRAYAGKPPRENFDD